MPFNWDPNRPAGRVEDYASRADAPPISSLVDAFDAQDVSAADAIVLRGYLGRSDILTRALDYLRRAQRLAGADALAPPAAEPPAEAQAAGDEEAAAPVEAPQAPADGVAEAGADAIPIPIEPLIAGLEAVRDGAKAHIPWRLYLTPRLDRYVDFHRSSLLAWRQEPKAERQDACTVWLRVFEKGAQVPIPYRLIQETALVPSFASWINGQFVDDYGDDGGGAWGDQSGGISGANRTGPFCANKTGRTCMA